MPRLVSPPTVLCLWLLVGLLLGGSLLVWFAPVPRYTSGPAAVTHWQGPGAAPASGVVVVAFVLPQDLVYLQVGQPLFLQLEAGGQRLPGVIIAVESEISSPDDARALLARCGAPALAITQPSVVVLARLDSGQLGLPPSTYLGSVGQAQIAIGSRQLLGLVRGSGPLTGM